MSYPYVNALIKMATENNSRHGGKRPGAGRKKSGKKLGGPHRARPALSCRHPVHVTLRTVPGVPRLRQRCFYEALRRVLAYYLERDNFRVVHISIQHNHIHLLAEAAGSRALTRGMQSFAINAARAINAAWGRTGKVFAYRYHSSQIKTAHYARNALSYVLNNWRRHREDDRGATRSRMTVDWFSSAVSFNGWSQRVGKPPPPFEPLPVSRARTSLLAEEWKLYGLILTDEVPGPIA